MYIRRKVFSVITDEYGDERYFSTTEFINEDAYLEDRMYATWKDPKTGDIWKTGGTAENPTRELLVRGKDLKNYEDGIVKESARVTQKKTPKKYGTVEAGKTNVKDLQGGGMSQAESFKIDKARSKKELQQLKKDLKKLNEQGRGAAAKKEAEALIATRKAAASRLRGEGAAIAEKAAKSKLGKVALAGAAGTALVGGGAYYAGRRANK